MNAHSGRVLTEHYPTQHRLRALVGSKRQRDDLIIGDNEWIAFVDHDWANVAWFYIDSIIEPLSPLFKELEIECVVECCGLGAFSFERDDILGAVSVLNEKQLVADLNRAITDIEALTNDVLGSKILNNGIDRGTMLDLLRHVRQTIAKGEAFS